MLVRTPTLWSIPDRQATPEHIFANRRQLIRRLGLASVGSALAFNGLASESAKTAKPKTSGARIPTADLYPARLNTSYSLEEHTTPESLASRHNVFDEFSSVRDEVWKVAERFEARPWKIHVGGAVEKPLQFDADELTRKIGIEERVYRFRCVETWAMVVPWTGFPLRRLLEVFQPLPEARYVRMVTAARPEQMPGWYATRRVFPYYEAISLAEASNDLAFIATGIYGHPLPNQHGAPLRLVLPWKYGLKGIKSIVAFQLTRERPGTFWNELAPHHYSWESNVDPTSPGQEEETLLETGEVRKTQRYNGYGEKVANLYA